MVDAGVAAVGVISTSDVVVEDRADGLGVVVVALVRCPRGCATTLGSVVDPPRVMNGTRLEVAQADENRGKKHHHTREVDFIL